MHNTTLLNLDLEILAGFDFRNHMLDYSSSDVLDTWIHPLCDREIALRQNSQLMGLNFGL